MLTNFLNFLWLITSVFMILVILIQKGRGGGLAGAFGAVGGSSAFGTKAGDLFTKITVGVFAVWLFLGMGLVHLMTTSSEFKEAVPEAAAAGTEREAPKSLRSPNDLEGLEKSAPVDVGLPPAGAATKNTPAPQAAPTTPPAKPAANKSKETPPAKSKS